MKANKICSKKTGQFFTIFFLKPPFWGSLTKKGTLFLHQKKKERFRP